MPEPPSNERTVFQRALGPGPDCPDVEALAAAHLDPAFQQHVKTCSHCQTELALVHEFETAEPAAHELADVQWIESQLAPRLSVRDRLAAWIAGVFLPARTRILATAGVGFLMVAGIGLYFAQDGTPHRTAPTAAPVWRSAPFRAIVPSGEVAQLPSEFRWEPVAGAASYHLELREIDRTVVWSFDTSAVTAAIPPEVARKLTPGRAFDWLVNAQNTTGKLIAVTDLQNFRIPLTTR